MHVSFRHIVGVCFLMAGAVCRTAAGEWDVVSAKHFLVYHMDTERVAAAWARRAETEYRRIRKDLGLTKYDEFWLWDKRIRIFVYPSRREFLEDSGAPAWAAGKASYGAREIATFAKSEDFLQSVLPHELTHLVLRDFMGMEGDAPLWLHEGVAQWEEPGVRRHAHRDARRLLRRNRLLPVRELADVTSTDLQGPQRAVLFYKQSVSLVGYLMEVYGADRFRVFCGHLRDGKGLEEALRFTYPGTVRTIQELEEGWIRFLQEGGSSPDMRQGEGGKP